MAFEELTKRHADVWSSAPFENIADTISDMHDTLVETLAPREGEAWLDVGCGVGDVAFRAARAGATVTGSDLSPTLIETARSRADALGLDLMLEVGDCQQLPYEDASFDVVSSSVGVIFAPDHQRVAAELKRVCRPGGRLGITAWRRSSGVGGIFAAMAPFMPPPPEGVGSPFQWGDESYCEQMLDDAYDLSFTEHDSPQFGESGDEIWQAYRESYGPIHTLWRSLDDDRRAELATSMTALFDGSHRGSGVEFERIYIIASGTRR